MLVAKIQRIEGIAMSGRKLEALKFCCYVMMLYRSMVEAAAAVEPAKSLLVTTNTTNNETEYSHAQKFPHLCYFIKCISNL